MTSKTIKRFAPVALLIGAGITAYLLFTNPPQAKRRSGAPAPQITVETKVITPQMYQVQLPSFGTVQPRTQSALVAQVSGQIIALNENFRQGGFFEKGDVLLTIDDRDYKADVLVAEAALLDAQQRLIEEKARSKQALVDWQRLGNTNQPSDLVLRKPQLEASKASLLSAQARLQKAKLKLERTQVIAPYSGRVLTKKVDIGQVVSGNTNLATIYATDYVEVRLPLQNQDLQLIDLPEQYRDQQGDISGGLVQFESDLYPDQQWQGQLVRTEGAIDNKSQQLYVVAQINNPYQIKQAGMAIKIGQYVQASVAGKLLSNVIVVPNQSVYQGSYVYVVEDGVIKRRDVQLLWRNQQESIIAKGLTPGEQLVMTSLGRVSSGTPVSIMGDKPPRSMVRGPNKGQRQPGMKRPQGDKKRQPPASKSSANAGAKL